METCCSRGWVGFKASWVQDTLKTPAKSFAETEREYKQKQYEEMVGRKPVTLVNTLEIENGSN